MLPATTSSHQSISARARTFFEATLRAVSFYVVPVGIALISLIALVAWDDLYVAHPERLVEFKITTPINRALSPVAIADLLEKTTARTHYETRLSETPVWFSFKRAAEIDPGFIIEFPSRHAVFLACWDARSGAPLGQSTDLENPKSVLMRAKTGYALRPSVSASAVICNVSFVGPASLTIERWSSASFDISVQDFHRKSGLLDGGMMILAIFVLITAIINRQSLYILFAAWLVVTLRISATAGGWDYQWLNHEVPAEWLSQGRSITRALWALLTVTLFKALFKDALLKPRAVRLVNLAHWLCLALFVAALVLPRSLFLPTMWVIGTGALVLLVVSLAGVVVRTRSRVAVWYAASLAFTFLSGLSEILAAAYGITGAIGALNTVTGALAASLLASLAIAEQMRQEHQHRLAAQAELQHTFDAVPVGLFSLDLEGRFISANPALLSMLGETSPTLTNRAWHHYFAMETWTRMQQLVHGQLSGDLEIHDHTIAGISGQRSYLVKATMASGKIEGSLQEITEKIRAAGHLQFLADNDSLTRSLNRRGIEKELGDAMTRLDKGRPLALAYLDLDRFKLINDLYGRNVGDEVLQHVCSRVNNVLSGNMRLGRLGGDEFLLVMPDTKIVLASLICRRIISSLGSRPYDIDDKAFHVRCSIGLIEVTQGTSIKDAVSTADRACRQAKGGNGEGLMVYERESVARLEYEAEIKLVELLSSSAATDGLHLVMQPIMSLSAPYDSLNFEVLLRMRDPVGNPIRTDRVIKAAESSGRMSVIDRWVLSTTLTWLNEHIDSLKRTRFICLNLNGASLNDERFLDDVVAMLTLNRSVAHQLCFEITESVALHDLENTRRFIDRVRSFGARVALDDFGAGYTSFSYLKDLPADLLKIDGSFIVNMNQHPANIAIVEAIVSLAGNLGMKTIAEWAEDQATVQTLHDIGVDYVQGFVVAKPQDPARLLMAHSSAEFILDEDLVNVIQTFSKTRGSRLHVDLFEPSNHSKLH